MNNFVALSVITHFNFAIVESSGIQNGVVSFG